MSGFSRVDGALHCDGVAAERIAREAGTPSYVYSAETIRAVRPLWVGTTIAESPSR